MGQQDTDVTLNREEFAMQRAYLFALTIRSDIQLCEGLAKQIEHIERNLAKLADVKSVFENAEVEMK